MIKSLKSMIHFILKVIMILLAAGIGLYAGYAKSNSKLAVTHINQQSNFSPSIKTSKNDSSQH